jgi:hypothetical protein
VRQENSVTVGALQAEITSRGHMYSALSADFPADWELVLDFLGRHTSPGAGWVGDIIEDCVARASSDPSMAPGT